MDQSSSSAAGSAKPFFMCCQCRTQICLAIPYPRIDRKKDYVQAEEKNVRVAAGALESYDNHRTYIEVSCPNPNFDKILGKKLISEQVGDEIVAKEGKIRVYMRNLLLREGNIIYSHHFVPIETIRDDTQP